MDERVKQQSNEWIVKLTLISLSIILVAGLGAGGYVGYLYCQLYHEHDAEALVALYGYGFRSFSGVELQEARLERVHLQNVDLEGANLQCARLDFANMKNVNLRNANLQKALLRRTNLSNANLQGANLQRACLRGVPTFSMLT